MQLYVAEGSLDHGTEERLINKYIVVLGIKFPPTAFEPKMQKQFGCMPFICTSNLKVMVDYCFDFTAFSRTLGASVNHQTTMNDHTVLSLACAGGHLAVVELLLAHGADPLHKLKVRVMSVRKFRQ